MLCVVRDAYFEWPDDTFPKARGDAMKLGTVCFVLVLAIGSCPTRAQQPVWQQKMEESRRAAARGEAEIFSIGPGSPWVPGTYVYNNSPRPFCYAFTIPGEWNAERNRPGVFRSKDGRSAAGVTFLPPRRLEGVEGATLVERARNYSVRQREREFRQPLTNVELVPFESARPGTWHLKAAPVAVPDGRTMAFPMYVIVDFSPHTVAEINVMGTGDHAQLAHQIIESLKTTVEPECYLADLERLYKFMYGER